MPTPSPRTGPVTGEAVSLEQTLKGKLAKAAYQQAKKVYGDELDRRGVPYIVQVAGVAEMLAPFRPDDETLAACFLQHALHHNHMTLAEIELKFGDPVRAMVQSIHLLSLFAAKRSRASIEDLRSMLLKVTDDVRVLLIVLCKRCYVLEHMEKLSIADQKELAQEAIRLFAPVAGRLGIHSVKQRLENAAFPVAYPADYERIVEQLEQVNQKYGNFLPKASLALQKELYKQGIDSVVYGREKQPFSIFTKMKDKSLTHVESLPDLFALRIIVKDIEQCYPVLGTLHQLGRPVGNRFKDYIALPKPNGYQSLHTTVARLPGVPEGLYVEVQVRTEAMQREADFGIAAHWSYKEGGKAAQAMRRTQLQQMLGTQLLVEEKGKQTGLAEHIVVLTPNGDIIELPEGSTPLDFAFQIHTNLGLTFKSSRVNGRIVPLTYTLENGDVVEILTHKAPQPSESWMHLLKTASSRSRLRRYLHSLHRDDYIAKGRERINAELKKFRLPQLDTDLSVLRSLKGKVLSQAARLELLANVGEGSIKPAQVFSEADLLAQKIKEPPKQVAKQRMQRKDSLVEIDGGLSMPMKFAKCCKPQDKQGTPIVGFNRAGEVSIHLVKCKMIKKANPGRKVRVWWRKS